MLMPCIATLQQLLESTRFFLVIHALAIAIGIWYWFRYRSNSKRRHQNRQLTPEVNIYVIINNNLHHFCCKIQLIGIGKDTILATGTISTLL